MNLDRLRVFVVAAETGTLTAASRRLHLTQPALSRSVRVLEEELGVSLFVRTGRRLQLSPAGRSLLPEARRLLEHCEVFTRQARRIEERGYHDIRLGMVDSIATYLFPSVVTHLRDRFSGLALRVHTARSTPLLERVERGTLDYALVAWSGPPPRGHVVRIARYDLQYYGLKHRFAGLARVQREEELAEFPLVQLEPLPGQPSLTDDESGSYALVGSLASVKALVLHGFGVGALLSFMLTGRELRNLVRAKVPHDPKCALFMVARHAPEGRHRNIEAELVSSMRAALREKPRP